MSKLRSKTAQTPTGGKRKTSKPKRNAGRRRSKASGKQKTTDSLFETAQKKKKSRKPTKKNAKMGQVLLDMHLDSGSAPKNWPGLESSDQHNKSSLDTLFDTYWAGGDAEAEEAPVDDLTRDALAAHSPLKKRKTGAGYKVTKSPKQKEFLSRSPTGSKRARAMLANTMKLQKKAKPVVSAKDRLLAKTPSKRRSKRNLLTPLSKMHKKSSRVPRSPVLQSPQPSPSSKLSLMTLSSPPVPVKTPQKVKKGCHDTFIPLKLQLLHKKFNAMETTFRFHSGRGQFGCTFKELKRGVERVVKKSFTQDDLAKLNRVVPDLLHIKWTLEVKPDGKKKKNSYELCVFPMNHLAKENRKASIYTHFLKGAVCTSRLELLQDRLTAYTRAKHKKFCKDKGVAPLTGRFHQSFELDEVDVKASELPKEPKRTSLSARDALIRHGQGTRLMTGRIQEKLSKLSAAERVGLSDVVKNSMAKYQRERRAASKKRLPTSNLRGSSSRAKKEEVEEEVLDMSKIPENLRHLPRSTLLKLQGRSKAKDIMKVDKKLQQRKLLLEGLPEVVRVLKAFMKSSKRTAMPYFVLVSRLCTKTKVNPGSPRMQKMLEELCRIAPDFSEIKSASVKIFKLKAGCKASYAYAKIKSEIRSIKL